MPQAYTSISPTLHRTRSRSFSSSRTFFSPQHHIEAEGVFGTGGEHSQLVEVLLMSSLGFCSFNIKVGADLDK
jgi:hypothetical protein